MKLIFFIAALTVKNCVCENETPIVGILSQETYIIKNTFPNETFDSFIAASYVKFLESAGARVLPVWIGQDEDYYRKVVDYTNGLYFPGGGTWFNETGGYAEAALHLYRLAVEANDKGDYYPVWGTCLGMQVLPYAALNGSKDIRIDCTLKHTPLQLDFVEGYRTSRLFSKASPDVIGILKSENVTYNQHGYCLTQEVLKENDLQDDWRVMSTNNDSNGLEFISSFEHTKYPFYGVQFHPEKNQYEFKRTANFPHSVNAIKAGQFFANFFVEETRKSAHKFPSDELEDKSLIYNFNPRYTGINDSYYEQLYVFVKSQFEENRLE